jgi:hypothetical protein
MFPLLKNPSHDLIQRLSLFLNNIEWLNGRAEIGEVSGYSRNCNI